MRRNMVVMFYGKINNPHSGIPDSWDAVKKFYDSDVRIPTYADITGKWDERTLTLSWKTDIGTYGSCELPCSKVTEPSELKPIITDWSEFRNENAHVVHHVACRTRETTGEQWPTIPI